MTRNLILLLLFISSALPAQSIKKGYKFLSKGEFEKASEAFSEVLSENKGPAASFGLAMVYGDERSPLHNLIRAWEQARNCKQDLEKLTPEELEIIGGYFTETEVRQRSIPVKKKMEYAIETIEAQLIKYIREENNLEIVYEVLEKFPDFRYHDNVIHIRNQLEFRKYEKQNTLEGYLEFMQKFPEAAQVEKAIRYRNQISFEKARALNTPEAFKEFMEKYPDASECSQAIKLLYAAAFEKARKINTVAGFETFMHDYPDALEVADARNIQKQLLYEYAQKIRTLEAYNEFIRKYPEGQQYIDIFNLRSLDIGTKTIEHLAFPSTHVQWARSFGQESSVELSSCLAVDSLNGFIAGGTRAPRDSGTMNAWVVKLAGDGKMIWNKEVGEEFNDELRFLEVTAQNQILGIGHTWLGSDSSSRRSWIFRLGSDGQKLWSKKLADLEINCVLTRGNGTLFLGGYTVGDTSGVHYSMVALNDHGKKLWSRTYTGNGQIVSLRELPENRLLLAGNHWRAKMDPRGYLVWESAFNASDSIMNALTLSKGEILYAGVRNGVRPVLVKTSSDNKLVYEKELAVPDTLISIPSLFTDTPGTALALFTFSNRQVLAVINTLKGELTSLTPLPEGLNVEAIRRDLQGNLLLVAHPGEILVIRMKGSVL
jgi:hypothetical protein